MVLWTGYKSVIFNPNGYCLFVLNKIPSIPHRPPIIQRLALANLAHPKKIAVTGATGFVGQQLVALFCEDGFELVLLGRKKSKLKAVFPQFPCWTYDQLGDALKGVDAIIHLACMNNTSTASAADFEEANVSLFEKVIYAAQTNGVQKVINVTTLHVFSKKSDHYSLSKRKAIEITQAVKAPKIHDIFCPAIYGATYSGRLGVLNYFPRFVQNHFLTLLSAFVPTVHVRKVSALVTKVIGGFEGETRNLYIANSQLENIYFQIFKRTIDICFALLVLLLFQWALLFIWLTVFLTSRGPGLYIQKRVGINGSVFNCYKFRTMHVGTTVSGSHEINPSQVTFVGKFLRKSKLDELPQALNVLRGDLSLVGPRPCLEMQHEVLRERERRNLLSIKPGITGYAQVKQIDMSTPELLAEVDARYVVKSSINLELSLIFGTIFGSSGANKN